MKEYVVLFFMGVIAIASVFIGNTPAILLFLRAANITYKADWVSVRHVDVVNTVGHSSGRPFPAWELLVEVDEPQQPKSIGIERQFYLRNREAVISARDRTVINGYVSIRRSSLFNDSYIPVRGQLKLHAYIILVFPLTGLFFMYHATVYFYKRYRYLHLN
jgi:hypothetical protein